MNSIQNKKFIGSITENEKEEILKLFTKIQNLKQLLDSYKKENIQDFDLVQKIEVDFNNNLQNYDNWWRNTCINYNWDFGKNDQKLLDFSSNEVFTIEN